MSQLTQCNYCTLQDFKRLAATLHQEVTLVPGPIQLDAGAKPPTGPRMEGINVLIGGNWAGWFMKLSDHCVCNGKED